MAIVLIPSSLRSMVQGKSELQIEGSTVKEVLISLEKNHPGVTKKILQPDQKHVRNFVSIFVDQNDIRSFEGLETPTTSNSQISILTAISGG